MATFAGETELQGGPINDVAVGLGATASSVHKMM